MNESRINLSVGHQDSPSSAQNYLKHNFKLQGTLNCLLKLAVNIVFETKVVAEPLNLDFCLSCVSVS